MRLLVLDGLIAGIAGAEVEESSLPTGFTIAEYAEEVPIESLYFLDGEVNPIPDRPSDRHHWNGKEWVELIIQEVIASQASDWEGLLSDLRSSVFWQKAFQAASTSLPANAAWTVLQSSLTATRHSEDFEFAIGALRRAMAAGDGGDFTQNQIKMLNKMLADRGFGFKIPLTL
jgi:hypothetical protein